MEACIRTRIRQRYVARRHAAAWLACIRPRPRETESAGARSLKLCDDDDARLMGERAASFKSSVSCEPPCLCSLSEEGASVGPLRLRVEQKQWKPLAAYASGTAAGAGAGIDDWDRLRAPAGRGRDPATACSSPGLRHGASVASVVDDLRQVTGHLHRPVAEAVHSDTATRLSPLALAAYEFTETHIERLQAQLEPQLDALWLLRHVEQHQQQQPQQPYPTWKRPVSACRQWLSAADPQKIIRRNLPATSRAKMEQLARPELRRDGLHLTVQQYIQQLTKADPSNVDLILNPPEGQDINVWKYETPQTVLYGVERPWLSGCKPNADRTQMTATEQWIFLCAAHRTPMECSAIDDYTGHTLDGAACLLNSSKYFPSRVSIKEASIGKLASIWLIVFSHAYFHHRGVFDAFEEETYLCRRFTVFVMKYQLMTKENSYCTGVRGIGPWQRIHCWRFNCQRL
uniref:MOB kinase activator-like 2 n=1 Tax=Macrostomum lignano TaxID=282301 RepID=A0A1I8FII8_9PLAT